MLIGDKFYLRLLSWLKIRVPLLAASFKKRRDKVEQVITSRVPSPAPIHLQQEFKESKKAMVLQSLPTLLLAQDLPGNSSWKTTITYERDTNERSQKGKEQIARCGPRAATTMARPADAGERQSRQWPPQTNLSPVSTDSEASPGGKFPGHVNNYHSHSPSLSALVCVGSAVGPFRSHAHLPPSAAQIPLTNKRRQFLRR